MGPGSNCKWRKYIFPYKWPKINGFAWGYDPLHGVETDAYDEFQHHISVVLPFAAVTVRERSEERRQRH